MAPHDKYEVHKNSILKNFGRIMEEDIKRKDIGEEDLSLRRSVLYDYIFD